MLIKISVVYAMIHMLILFFMVYQSRYRLRTLITASALVIGSISVVVIWMLFHWGVAAAGQYGMIIGTVPTLLLFFFMAKERNARFVFTFCLADTIALWVQMFSALVNYAVGSGGTVTFLLRLVIFPVMEYAIWRWGRRLFFEMMHTVRRGWLLFSVMTGVSYLLLSQLSVYPTSLLERPEDMPVASMVLALIALTYTTIFLVLYGQISVFRSRERQRILEVQAAMMERRAFEVRQTEEKLAIERHDLRHRLQAVAALVQQEDKAAALEYIGASQAVLDRTGQRRFCKNVVLDAVLSSFFARAQERGIVMESRLTIPDTLPVDATELSTVFANALENAIHACEKVSPEQRRITCTCAASPRLRFEVANPYAGKVRFGPDGLPVSERPGHGIGIHSITAFAEKNHAVCRFVTENGWFKMQMVL